MGLAKSRLASQLGLVFSRFVSPALEQRGPENARTASWGLTTRSNGPLRRAAVI